MSEIDDERLSPEAERAREALGAAVREDRPPRADLAVRERLREEFASGRIEERGGLRAEGGMGARVKGGVGARAEAGVGTRSRAVPARRPWIFGPALRVAFAAAALLLFAGLLNQGTSWRVLPDVGAGAAAEPGVVVIDGLPTETTDVAALRSRLKPGAEIRMATGAPLRLVSGGALALELPPGAALTLPPPPARWIQRESEIHSRGGEIRITTGPDFRGARLAVHTAESIVEVTGTTVAVIRDEHGTCVCVLEGVVRMGRAPGRGNATNPAATADPAMAKIPAGIRCLIYKDSSPPLMEPISEMERAKLAMFREAAAAMMGPGK